jgi:F0F1-type ATP synthase membrane subunit b/b'
MTKEFVILSLVSLTLFAVALYFINKGVKKLKGKSKEEIQNYVDEKLDSASKGTILKNILKFFSDLFF